MRKFFIVSLILLFWPFVIVAEEHTIKPGVVITKENYKNYIPQLKTLLSPTNFRLCVNGLEKGWVTLPIVEKSKICPKPAITKWTAKMQGKCRVTEKNKLTGWVAGVPFVPPETGAELAWDIRRAWQGSGDILSMEVPFYLYDKNYKREREFKIKFGRRPWMGRLEYSPIPEEPGNNGVVQYKIFFVMLEPFDVRGFLNLRISYDDPDKDDDVYAYIPALRRIRRLTGRDVTDPILGSDFVFDDFECTHQKIDSRMTFNMREKEILVPASYNKKPPEPYIKGNIFQTNWEKRNCYVSEWNINNPNYVYKKRVIYADAEKESQVFPLYGSEEYDHRGRIWRSLGDVVFCKAPETFYSQGIWYGCT